jgi:glyoxylase-like metal-dependent hydrolase (beta-lactamase superfamily II)
MKGAFLVITTVLAVCLIAGHASAQDERALRVLDAALEKLGGEASIRSLKSVYYSARGTENGSALGQDYSATKELVNSHEERLAVFLDGKTLSYEYKTDRGDGTTRWRRFTFVDSRRVVADFVNRAAFASPARHPNPDRDQDARRIPHAFLLEINASRSLMRYDGPRQFHDASHDVVTLTLPNTKIPVSLYFDPKTNLLSKYEFTADFPGLGKATLEYVFTDWQRLPRLEWGPRSHRIVVNGKVWRDVKFGTFAADSPEADAMLGLPPELEGFVAPAGTVKEIARGVYFVYGVGGFQPMFIEFKDFVLAVEAPATHPSLDETPLESMGTVNSVSDELISKIKQTIPNKPIRYVAITHAHSDHMGGLRAFVPEKSTVLTAAGDRPFYDKFVPDLKIETIDGRRTITDGERTIELISVGANPHTGENVIVYLPREKFLFQGDLFYFNGDATFPPKDRMTVMPFFAKWLKKNGMSPTRIYGFHSPLYATMEHVEKVLEISASQSSKKAQ